MLKQFLQKIKFQHRLALREQKGQSLIIFTFAFLGLVAMLGLALDLGLVYIEQVRVGRTADAATLAAVVELPSEEEAVRRAIEYIELNGYDVTPLTGDTEIVVRGCIKTLMALDPGGGADVNGNVSEGGVGVAHGTVITPTTTITGATLSLYDVADPVATFMIDTYSYQASTDGNCDAADNNKNGDAQKIQVMGKVNVHMNFMQFFGFSDVPVQDVALAENITNLDVMVVFDVSGSMESETTCYDCWVRTDPNNPNYPDNGYFNPLPYDPALGTTNQSIPHSDLCVANPTAILDGGSHYLVHEAELYSYNKGNWNFNARTQGQGFWVLQRGSRERDDEFFPAANGYYQGNRAGKTGQSSNVCEPDGSGNGGPGIVGGGLSCTISGDNVCASGGIERDCSAYIKAHPYFTYTQRKAWGDPKLQGGAYDATCFTNADGTCWTDDVPPPAGDESRPNETLVPYVEYDFTPTSDWSVGQTHIWARVASGGLLANKWNGVTPSTVDENWRQALYWQVMDGTNPVNTVQENTAVGVSSLVGIADWRDNRVVDSDWQWIKLGAVNTSKGTQYTLRLYQGSAGYKVDKIVFTDDGGTPSILSNNGGKGPPATNGSATRESCNVCNPAFGYEVLPSECNCAANAGEVRNFRDLGTPGTADGCTAVIDPEGKNQLEDDLYNGIEPLRSAQEAVKDFARRLDTDFDQIGIISFTSNAFQANNGRSTHLQCKRADPDNCENDDDRFLKALQTIEQQWPTGGTNIADGLLQGLIQLGAEDYASDHDCDTTNPLSACDRTGARKILILMTDGAPNAQPSWCNGGAGSTDPFISATVPDLWDGDAGKENPAYECSIHLAERAANAGIIVYTIGIGAGVDADLLIGIAEGRDPHSSTTGIEAPLFSARGGQFFNASTANDLEAIFTQILGNIYVRIL